MHYFPYKSGYNRIRHPLNDLGDIAGMEKVTAFGQRKSFGLSCTSTAGPKLSAAHQRVPRFLALRRRSMEEPPSGAGPVSPGRPLPSPCAFGGGGGGVGALPLRAPWLAAGFACAGRSSRSGAFARCDSRASGGALRPPAGAAPGAGA
ncbi:hypothetical protein, partial [Paenibacillus sp. HGF5]|uniref:hypothetical protein n=1 Tax=Paenibacillus sp. HGF5 TaxID=908341 RepID=UPI001C30A24D